MPRTVYPAITTALTIPLNVDDLPVTARPTVDGYHHQPITDFFSELDVDGFEELCFDGPVMRRHHF